MIGHTLAHYEITAKLGEGGMGEVYRATDTKLGREVALKVLPATLTQDPERVARFEREARTLASLQHANIASIYGFEEAGEVRFLVMELVAGQDLAQRLERGALPLDDAVSVAQQIAEGLENAHEKSIVHRDLKPANVQLGPDGQVKILDFGLARAVMGDDDEENLDTSPTITAAMTQAGVVLGTAAYMSPEQAKGKRVDKRADIWSFGVLLFEMITGDRLFQGETVSETLAAVLLTEVDWSRLPENTPQPLVSLLRRCLERDPSLRLRDVGEARIALSADLGASAAAALGGARTGGDGLGSQSKAARWSGRLGWVVAAVAVAAAGWLGLRSDELPTSAEQVPITADLVPSPEHPYYALAGAPELSPDGSRLAYVTLDQGLTHLSLRDMSTGETRRLPRTRGAMAPFWAPDGKRLGFFAEGKVKKIGLATDLVESIADAEYPGGATWSENEEILFSLGWYQPLLRVSSNGGEPRSATVFEGDHAGHTRPQFLPDGRHFLFVAREIDGTTQVRVGSLDKDEGKLLFRSRSRALYSPPGVLLWWQEGILRGQRFDAAALELKGEPFRVASGVQLDPRWATPLISVSQNGSLIYQPGTGLLPYQMTWFDRQGVEQGTLGPSGNLYQPNLSPDERLLALDMSNEANSGDIYLFDVKSGDVTQFTYDSADDSAPVWSPDSSRIAFLSSRSGGRDVWQRAIRGAGEETPFIQNAGFLWPTDWSHDGSQILCSVNRRLDAPRGVFVYSIAEKSLTPFVDTQNAAWDGCFSPDDNWIAYVSNETGRAEVYVKSNPPTEERWRVSNQGGRMPHWVGNELFYATPTGTIMVVAVETKPRFHTGAARALFSTTIKDHNFRQFNVTADGQRLLVNRAVEVQEKAPLVVRLGWAKTLD